jgi:hypothetical protein
MAAAHLAAPGWLIEEHRISELGGAAYLTATATDTDADTPRQQQQQQQQIAYMPVNAHTQALTPQLLLQAMDAVCARDGQQGAPAPHPGAGSSGCSSSSSSSSHRRDRLNLAVVDGADVLFMCLRPGLQPPPADA